MEFKVDRQFLIIKTESLTGQEWKIIKIMRVDYYKKQLLRKRKLGLK